ncbi:MAG: hypothetical protein U5K84_03955 [Alkalibacterium sp.]|nr:hypothetical protein [Alkalibacterium sp.]
MLEPLGYKVDIRPQKGQLVEVTQRIRHKLAGRHAGRGREHHSV